MRRHGTDPLTHVERVPARAGRDGRLAGLGAGDRCVAASGRRGITAPWRHQVEAAELAHAGEHVVIATGTASGKSLAYQLPVLATLLADPRATALYLAPTKALAADQLRAVGELGPRRAYARPAYDGDTPQAEREWVRAHSRFVLTNPDMLHRVDPAPARPVVGASCAGWPSW